MLNTTAAKLLLILAMLPFAQAIQAANSNHQVYSKADFCQLCEMMSIQARTGVIICSIAAEWRLQNREFRKFADSGPKLAQAVMNLSGKMPEPVLVSAPDFTEDRAKLLIQAAAILAKANATALKCYNQKVFPMKSAAALKRMNARIAGILDAIAQ